MSRIDELQRLHEAATPGVWVYDEFFSIGSMAGEVVSCNREEGGGLERRQDGSAIVALHNSWPAIHRVLLAARSFMNQANVTGAIGYGPNQEVELTQYADTYDKLREALRALDGDKGAT